MWPAFFTLRLILKLPRPRASTSNYMFRPKEHGKPGKRLHLHGNKALVMGNCSSTASRSFLSPCCAWTSTLILCISRLFIVLPGRRVCHSNRRQQVCREAHDPSTSAGRRLHANGTRAQHLPSLHTSGRRLASGSPYALREWAECACHRSFHRQRPVLVSLGKRRSCS